MSSTVKRVALASVALLLVGITATAANNTEQVVFSGQGSVMTLTGNTKAPETPFGFWIWCAAAGSHGGYQTDNACQGSMYFYVLDTNATSVIG